MTTIDIHDTPVSATPPARAGWLGRWLRRLRTWRAQRRTLHELELMNPYLLRDMGIEPQDVIDALEGRQSSLLFNPMRRHDPE